MYVTLGWNCIVISLSGAVGLVPLWNRTKLEALAVVVKLLN